MNDEGSGFGVVERTGAVAKAKGKEAEDGDVLEEAFEGSGDRLDGFGGSD